MSAPELTEVRHPIDKQNLTDYLKNVTPQSTGTTLGVRVPDFSKLESLDIKQFKFGQSNPTYLLTDEDTGREYVLRKKPSPNKKIISKSAHAVEREFFMLRSIGLLNEDPQSKGKVPIPNVYLLCEDESIIGYVFYVMEYIKGVSIKDPGMPGIPEEDRKLYWNSIIDTISSIHLLDAEKLISNLPPAHYPQFQNLEKLKSSTYFQRQIRTLNSIANLQTKQVKPIPDFDKICDWLLKTAPRDPTKLTLIHGDCKIDNFLFDPTTKTVKGVLDWELCTIGHPLFDWANFLQPFNLPNALNTFLLKQTDTGKENPASLDLIYSVLGRYSEKITWDSNDPSNNPSDLWLVGFVFGLLRLCVISQGIAMRVKQGSASSSSAAGPAKLYPILSNLALEGIEQFEEQRSSGSKRIKSNL
ncbi:protein serine/threonine kinase activity protein [Scheffersomyces xylosifermentans]|uniref:protein serine/threonine kinase activity protein n=1 Tax=Scheffersomyces xylosifermentans TaxID=1304137 RepID=UPI00315CC08D